MNSTTQKVFKIKFPNSFKMFGTKVNIEQHQDTFVNSFRFLDGMADETNNTIHINTGGDINYALNTMTHEFLHLLLYALGLPEHSNNEQLVHGLALGFNAYLLDNPEILKLFQKVAKENNTIV